MDKKDLVIRNSTAEFLIFEKQSHAEGIEVRYEDGTLWLTQKMIGELFDVESNTITYHLKEIYSSGELEQEATARKFRVVQTEGKRQVARSIVHYNLDAVISVGYRVNSVRATQFRRWATAVLSKFAQQGYVLDRKRMENGAFLDEDYFEHLLEEIREIRLSERRFYQKITDIYATAIDYDKNAPTTKKFFAKVQNKMHYAITKHTAAEIIYNRADSEKGHMGLTTWEKAPDGKIVKSDVSIAKNYLSKDEIEDLGRIVSAFLELAESAAKRHIPLTMEDWANRIDKFLLSDDRDVLQNAGKISMEIAKDKAETEFEKYRITQDRLFESDFDKLLADK
ncbi:virulence RhuM family protein [Lutispora saccharofermentans]|uniref:Virulence RhuM family protein n=1 Tax=Lutispora saccharofermentans TaxID=3024236 RepID=A0ABT1NB90_9FIRM|nr:virulence RhuM family protein [Lutispora saccharofermentans]MCQ1528537.1 virulence RhuM family protein [Lutispora saccharofermentans]